METHEALTTTTAYPWSTMECRQPTGWTTNQSLLVASSVKAFPSGPYPELRTWMVVRTGVISVFTSHLGNAPASPYMRPTTWLCPTCLPTTSSTPAPIQPTTAMTNYIHTQTVTNYTHTPTVTNMSASHSQL